MTSTSGSSAAVGYRFPREVIAVALRWYLRYSLSCLSVNIRNCRIKCAALP
jgi:transposase-like protein